MSSSAEREADLAAAQAICAAIDGRRRLGFSYQGLQRIVNPIRLGRLPRGEWQLRAVQVGGDSRSGRFGNPPKLFDLAEMTDVVALDAEFRVPHQYQRGDDAFTEIVAEL